MLGLLAHAVHLLLVVLGLVGVAVLLLPQVRAARGSRRTPTPANAHAARVAALRSAVHRGQLAAPPVALPAHSPLDSRGTSPATRDSSTWRAVAVASSVAAAGVHAAVFPHHLEEAFAIGAFFLLVTLAQAGWACLLVLDASRARLLAGIVGSLALVALWLVARTVGVPGVAREPVGGWDLAAAGWELIVVATCAVGLRRPAESRALELGGARPVAWAFAGASGVALLVLTLTVSHG